MKLVQARMIGPVCKVLAGRRLVLASGSPRRKQILENVKLPCDVVASQFEESLDKALFSEPWQYAVENARQKALEVEQRLQDRRDWVVVTGADTIVVLNNEILEKPLTPERALEMLHRLNGQTHVVHTGMALVCRGEGGRLKEHTFHESTEVTFAQLSEEVIQSYVESGEPLDKAGAYGIQGLGATLVTRIHGDYYNVVGLPLHRLCTELLKVLDS